MCSGEGDTLAHVRSWCMDGLMIVALVMSQCIDDLLIVALVMSQFQWNLVTVWFLNILITSTILECEGQMS